MIGPDLQSSGSEKLPMPPADPTRPTDRAAEAAAELWLARLAGELEAEERALEPADFADFEGIVRAAEHGLDEGERALWQERVARHPELARRAAELAAFRAEAYPQGARVLAFPRGSRATGPWLGWAAAAAALLLAVLLRSNAPTFVPEDLQAGPAPVNREEPVFFDGFEGGDPSSWTAVSSSG